MKNVWIVLCSSGIGGAERRALKLAICLAEQNKYKVNVLINKDLLPYFQNDTQINAAIKHEKFSVKIAEDYYKKLVNYRHFFGIIKKIDGYHSLLKRLPFLYRLLLNYFSYDKVFKSIGFGSNDVIHCFSTDAVRLGLIRYDSSIVESVIVELVGNKFLQRYANQISIMKYNPSNTNFKAVSETVLNNFNKALKERNISNLKNVSEWDGPFIYVPKLKVDINKENVIIFASRFNKPKNPVLFAKAIKSLFDSQKLGKWKVIIRGRGALEKEIKDILEDYIKTNRVEVGFSGELYKDFVKSKVVVSIIETGNYPSQSLFEALSYGVIPIISNTGNSKEKYNHSDVVFCDLDLEDLKGKILKSCTEIEDSESMFKQKSQSLIQYSAYLIKESNYLKELYQIYGE
jgi:glycosyltransferase involved in cell wall biosynthesis